MHARLRAQKSVRVFALDLEHRALDPRLFALAHIEHLDREAAALCPARVHAQQHRGPVLRLGATGAGADLYHRVAMIVGALEHGAQLVAPELLLESGEVAIELSRELRIGLRLE